jgi:dTMP kinase
VVEPTSEQHEVASAPLAALPLVAVDEDRPSLHVRLFGSHAFFRLWIAQVVSALGDWLGFLAITILAASVGSGSGGAAVGLVMSARIIPGFFLAPVAGVMIDRWDRKKVMVVCDLGRAAVIATLPFVHTAATGNVPYAAAKEASVPNIVPTDRLQSANSLSLAAAYGTFPVAAVLFALLAQLAKKLSGIDALHFLNTDQEALAFYMDMITFVLSAVMISTLVFPHSARRRAKENGDEAGEDDKGIDFAQTFKELKEGWQFIFVNPVVRSVILGLATGLMGGGMVVPLGSIFSKDVLGAGAAGYGVFITALGFGVAAGVLLLSVTQNKLPRIRIFELSIFGAGGALILAASMSSLTFAVVCVAALGVCGGSVYVVGFTLLHENVDDELRGRIFSALYTLVRLCLLIAFALGPFLSELLDRASSRFLTGQVLSLPGGHDLFLPGVRLTLWLSGFIVLVAGFFVFWSLRSGSNRDVDRV